MGNKSSKNNINVSNDRRMTQQVMSKERTDIQAKKASQMQGVHELKMNYNIESNQTVLGSGSFGKVFLSKSKHNPDFKVAIKALDKVKLRMDVDLIQ